MKTRIALLRGINVGGKHTLPMKELTAVLEGLGAREIRTYLQSGNAVFAGPGQGCAPLAKAIQAAVRRRRGFEPQVLLLDVEDLERAVRQNPYPDAVAAPSTLHLGFLAAAPAKPDLKSLEGLRKESERFRLIDRVFYLHAPDGVARSRLATGAERLLGVPMTDRNWRTVSALLEMARGPR